MHPIRGWKMEEIVMVTALALFTLLAAVCSIIFNKLNLPPLIGYIIAGVDREKRGLHDILCDTRVIYAKKIKVIPVYPRYQMPPVPPQNMNMQTPPGPQPWQQNTAPVQPQQKEEEIEVQENRRDS